jgi:hypothetical protein
MSMVPAIQLPAIVAKIAVVVPNVPAIAISVSVVTIVHVVLKVTLIAVEIMLVVAHIVTQPAGYTAGCPVSARVASSAVIHVTTINFELTVAIATVSTVAVVAAHRRDLVIDGCVRNHGVAACHPRVACAGIRPAVVMRSALSRHGANSLVAPALVSSTAVAST